MIWLLLPLGIALGWALARRTPAAGTAPPAAPLPTAATTPDAVPQEALRVLGAAYRREGDIARAIEIHARLVTAAEAAADDATHGDAARLELAQDYLKAGLMDRAEALLQQLVGRGTPSAVALELLISVHEQARDWKHAALVVERLQAAKGIDLRQRLAHYRCELAEQHRAAGEFEAAERQARRALDTCPESVRANLLAGDLAERRGDLNGALNAWKRVPKHDIRFISEALPRMQRACSALKMLRQFEEWLEELDGAGAQAACVVQARAQLIQARGGDVANYLAAHLEERVHWAGILGWVQAQHEKYAQDPGFPRIAAALGKHVARQPRFHCTACGLQPNLLFWQCPSCKQWGAIVPADGLRQDR